MNTEITGPILRPVAAAAYLGISKASFYRLVKAGDLQQPLKIGVGAVGYPKTVLDDFIARLAVEQQAIA